MRLSAFLLLMLPMASCASVRHSPSPKEPAYDLPAFALDRGELISPASYTAMMRPMRSHTGESLPYSVGWFAQRYAGHELRWHSGWWPDAYSALYLKVPEENLTLILLANSEGVWWDNPLGSAQVEQSSFAQAFFRAFL